MDIQLSKSQQDRISPQLYLKVKNFLLLNDPDGEKMLDWSCNLVTPPASPDECAGEIIWIILCAGRSAQAARTIEAKVWKAIDEGRPVAEAFGYRAKAKAIERAWKERESDFHALQQVLLQQDIEQLVSWCGSIPFVGDDTKFQLAKNFGADLCKPDIWLCRLAGIADKPRRAVKFRFPICMDLCRKLSDATGDRIATIDSMLWLACNKGVLYVGPDGGAIRFNEGLISARPIATW